MVIALARLDHTAAFAAPVLFASGSHNPRTKFRRIIVDHAHDFGSGSILNSHSNTISFGGAMCTM